MVEFCSWKNTHHFTDEKTEIWKSFYIPSLTYLINDTVQARLLNFQLGTTVPHFPLEHFQHWNQLGLVEWEQVQKNLLWGLAQVLNISLQDGITFNLQSTKLAS